MDKFKYRMANTNSPWMSLPTYGHSVTLPADLPSGTYEFEVFTDSGEHQQGKFTLYKPPYASQKLTLKQKLLKWFRF